MRAILTAAAVLTACFALASSACWADVDPTMQCANVNGDEELDITDAVYLLVHLFGAGPTLECPAASCGDINGDEEVDIADAVYLLGWLFLRGPAPQCSRFTSIGENEQGYPEYRHDPTGIIFVRLPGGTFNMGSPDEEPYHVSNEGPVHEVTLSAFLIAKYEVTQAEWEQVMGTNPSYFDGTHDSHGNPVGQPDNRDHLPVEQVSWDDIQEFESRTGLALPTEAQWEYACRAGTETAFSFGSGESCADWQCGGCAERDPCMWYCGNSEWRTREVGTRLPNGFGIHDMHGNVLEWCEDVWRSDFYSSAEAAGPDPLCTSGSGYRVNRGGSWYDRARLCRSAYRAGSGPSGRGEAVGFRPSAPSP